MANAKFHKSIEEVNIGAFPLRPKDEQNRKLLEEFIHELIETKSAETVANVIPQKGTIVHVPDRVLIGVAKSSSQKGYLGSFEDRTAKRYYTGSYFPTTIPLDGLHFFIPYISGKGIKDVYKITRIRTITGKEVKQLKDEEDNIMNDLRLAFYLEFSHSIGNEYIPIKTAGFIKDTFLDTTFEQIAAVNHIKKTP